MKTKTTFRQDNVKIDGPMRQTLRQIIATCGPDSKAGRRAAKILASGQRHMPVREARGYLETLGATA
jgi:hypothetical protein